MFDPPQSVWKPEFGHKTELVVLIIYLLLAANKDQVSMPVLLDVSCLQYH